MTLISDDLIRAYAAPVPRYTSYPAAPHFHEGIGSETISSWMSTIPETDAISLYVHIPFCDRMCWFCGCHTQHVERYDPVKLYLKSLYAEIALVASKIGRQQTVARAHLGGGSPSLLKRDDLVDLKAMLAEHFNLTAKTEISVEFDPTDLGPERVADFIEFGVTRASLGVQDFDPKVQETINRLQSFEQTKAVIDHLRLGGVTSVNIDALYGLPYQTLETLEDTLAKVTDLSPDRIALFGYAHVPWVKPHQKLIPDEALPGVIERFRQARFAEGFLVNAGYVHIGFDHFARPGDDFAKAAQSRQLRRNFQGYTTDAASVLIGLGTSAISQYPEGYAQNTKNRHEYRRDIEQLNLPISRGIAVSSEDIVIAAAIEAFLCDFRLDTASFKERFGQHATHVLAKCAMIAMRDEDGFFLADETGFHITEAGRPFVRSFVACLDEYFGRDVGRYSLAI